MSQEILDYNKTQPQEFHKILQTLVEEFDKALLVEETSTSKLFHRNPAWFLDGNPIVAYYVPAKKDRVRIMFWSGQSFSEPGLEKEGRFKAATKDYFSSDDLDLDQLRKWLAESQTIQWDYKHIVKNKGVLHRID